MNGSNTQSSSSYERIKNKHVRVLLSNQKARNRYTLILHSKLTNCVMHIFFLLFVLQMLLILGGIETNRGPELPIDDELSSSFNDSSEMSSIYETFSTSFSFFHLNIQSLVPKLDLIYAEYEHFDIMSFTETWLKGNNSDDSIELLNFQKPFRKTSFVILK